MLFKKFFKKLCLLAAMISPLALTACNTTEDVQTYRTRDGGIVNRIPVDIAVMPDGHQVAYAVNTHESFSISNQATQVAWCNRYGSSCKPLGGSVNGADGIASAGGRLAGGLGNLVYGFGAFGNNGGGNASVGPITLTQNQSGKFSNKNTGNGSSVVKVGVSANSSAENYNVNSAKAGAFSGSKSDSGLGSKHGW